MAFGYGLPSLEEAWRAFAAEVGGAFHRHGGSTHKVVAEAADWAIVLAGRLVVTASHNSACGCSQGWHAAHVERHPDMTGTLPILADKPMSEMDLVGALLFVGIILFAFAGYMMWAAARSHANRDNPRWIGHFDYGLPSFRWPWVLSYVFLATAGLLFLVAKFLWR